MDKKLLAVLACPICKGEVKYNRDAQELVCRADGVAFPIRDGIPVMLEQEARTLTVDERLDKS
ncbi:MAG: Trm112 family protein [Hahellaceae bacterium]|nr:Trm112 family protein [Hahellaceae bacterium]